MWRCEDEGMRGCGKEGMWRCKDEIMMGCRDVGMRGIGEG